MQIELYDLRRVSWNLWGGGKFITSIWNIEYCWKYACIPDTHRNLRHVLWHCWSQVDGCLEIQNLSNISYLLQMYYVRQLGAEALVDFVALVSRYFHRDKIFFAPTTPVWRCLTKEKFKIGIYRKKIQNLPFCLVIN